MRTPVLMLLLFFLTACAAPTSIKPATPTTTVTATSIALPSPNPTLPAPTAEPVLKVTPEVQVVLDSQKAEYAVNADGKAIIDLKNTEEEENFVLEEIGHIPTNDGLAKDILAGTDQEGNRYIFVESYGWVKDIDFSNSSINNPVEISWELVKHLEILNVMFALHYAENPTISPDAVEPRYWANVFRNNAYIGLQPMAAETGTSEDQNTKFAESSKPYSDCRFIKVTSPSGQDVIIIARNQKNPTLDDKKQIINLFHWMSKSRYDDLNGIIGSNNVSLLEDFLINNKQELASVLIPPSYIEGIKIPWNFNDWKDTGLRQDPLIASMQVRGELISLMPVDTQKDLLQIIASFYGGAKFKDGRVYSVRLESLPTEFALKPLLANFETWINPPR